MRVLLQFQPALLSLFVWMVAVGVGMLGLVHYETTPGPAAQRVDHWPTATRLPLDPDRLTLVLFAHPRCPCSRASIDELAQVMAPSQGRIAAQVIFFSPAGETEHWSQTDLWSSAAAIPGVRVSADVDGIEAKEFGAVTSGHVIVYTPDGRRLFSGGITGSRGHVGENAGRSALLAILNRESPETTELPVFGCPILKSSACNGRDNRCSE